MVTTFDKEQTRQLLSYRLELGLTQMKLPSAWELSSLQSPA